MRRKASKGISTPPETPAASCVSADQAPEHVPMPADIVATESPTTTLTPVEERMVARHARLEERFEIVPGTWLERRTTKTYLTRRELGTKLFRYLKSGVIRPSVRTEAGHHTEGSEL